jgi:hypothetical protein
VVFLQKGAPLDIGREDVGIITVSQAINSLGIVESVSTTALSMFGYNKRDLIGQVRRGALAGVGCGDALLSGDKPVSV